MYKLTLAVAFCVFVVVITGATGHKVSSRFDNVDVDMVLRNKRLLNNYIDCLLGTKACSPEGAEVKRILPESIKSECTDCSEKQKANSQKVLRYFLNSDNDYWERLEKIYDPTGEYKKRYCNIAKRDGLATGKRCN